MFDPSEKIKGATPGGIIQGSKPFFPPEQTQKYGRHLGHTKVGFAPKLKTRGTKLVEDFETGEELEPEVTRPPNRRERRAYLANAPRGIRELAKRNRDSYKFAHAPHPSYVWQYFEPEELARIKTAPEEEQKAAKRYVKNMLRRRKATWSDSAT